MDLEIRIFRDRIAKFIDGSDLPIEVILLCFRDFCNQLEDIALQEIQKQATERDEAEKKKKERDDVSE